MRVAGPLPERDQRACATAQQVHHRQPGRAAARVPLHHHPALLPSHRAAGRNGAAGRPYQQPQEHHVDSVRPTFLLVSISVSGLQGAAAHNQEVAAQPVQSPSQPGSALAPGQEDWGGAQGDGPRHKLHHYCAQRCVLPG